MKRTFSVALFFILFIQVNAAIEPFLLKTEYLINPLAINTLKPRLSWQLKSEQRNQYQSAFEIIVSDHRGEVESGKGSAWTSSKQLSAENINISYGGNQLQPFTRYYWRVRVYDAAGNVSAWSDPAWFETAVLPGTDWTAKWIGDERKQFERDEDFYKDDPMPLFRKQFSTTGKIAAARLYISGLGYYEAWINGKRVGDHVLDPGFTTFRKQVFYSTYDVTDLVMRGNNAIGIMLGNGWFNPLPLRLFGRFNLRNIQETGRPCVKAQLFLRYEDGTISMITTDDTWRTATGPVIRNNVYLGERYDARLEINNWTAASFTQKWKPASIVSGPSGKLTAKMIPPVRVKRTISPVSITEKGKDTFIVDMGENFAGVARIRVKGASGQKVVLRYGEDLFQDGRLNYLTTVAGQIKEIWRLNGGPGAPATAWQEDQYTLKGKGWETWAPRFTFHGFRFVEITGWPGRPDNSSIEGLCMHTDLQPAGTFSSSNNMFNQLQQTILRTFLSNVFSVQSDCPAREKMGYGADIVVTAEAFSYNFDMSQFYAKTVMDFANEQQPDGGITEVAPYTGIADKGYGGHSGPLGWQLAFPYVQKQLYDFYGDRSVIEQHYDGIKKQITFLRNKAINGLFHWDISDHEALDPKPEAFSAAAFYYHHAWLAASFAGILGKPDDSLEFNNLAQNIRRAIVNQYSIPNTGRFDNGTQSAQIFALWYGFTNEPEKSMQVLLSEFARHHDHISTGIFSTKMLFDVFREREMNEQAYTIANQRDYPGWGYMLQKGATTLWETWAYPDNAPSQNHPMFGSVGEWFYRSLLGINAAAPAFRKIIIKPQPVKDLSWARGSYESMYGTIVSDWKKEDGKFIFHVRLPVNTSAEVWIPSISETGILESNKILEETNDIKVLRHEKGYVVITVGSGTYNFTSSLQ